MSDDEITDIKTRLEEAHELIRKLGTWVRKAQVTIVKTENFCGEQKKINTNLYECLGGLSKKVDAIAEKQTKAKARAETRAKAPDKPSVRTTAHEFFEVRLIIDPASVIAKRDLYATYREWCRNNRLGHVDKVAFGMAILNSVSDCKVTRISREGERIQAYRGVRLLPPASAT